MTEYSYMCLMFYVALYVEMALLNLFRVWYRGIVGSTCGIVVKSVPRVVSW